MSPACPGDRQPFHARQPAVRRSPAGPPALARVDRTAREWCSGLWSLGEEGYTASLEGLGRQGARRRPTTIGAELARAAAAARSPACRPAATRGRAPIVRSIGALPAIAVPLLFCIGASCSERSQRGRRVSQAAAHTASQRSQKKPAAHSTRRVSGHAEACGAKQLVWRRAGKGGTQHRGR